MVTWNHIIVNKSFTLDWITWYHISVYKRIIKKKSDKKCVQLNFENMNIY